MAGYRYWQHFLALESDFSATSRFVEFAPANFKTFSVEYAKLLLAVGSEIDVLCKVICGRISPGARCGNIDEYRVCLTSRGHIYSEEVLIRRYGLDFIPWAAWASGTNPTWWDSYNNVKHHRHVQFQEANLENCVNAIAGLFVLVIYCHKAEASADELRPLPVLLGREREPGNLAHQADYTVEGFP